jgi:hypothetical protein
MTDLEHQARRALTELARSRTCSLGGIGTGNLLRVRERAFIVTAKHVADHFYKLKRPRIIFRHNYKILSEQSEYVSSTDDNVDIALIAVNDLKAEAVSYGYEDFKFIDDFRTYNFDRVNLQVCGFPAQLQHKGDADLFYSWMSYTTTPCLDPAATKDFLFCHYPICSPVRDSQTGDKVTLPAARGLSGAFILAIPAQADQSAVIWSPTAAKVIAIQIAWDKKNYIKCSNIFHVRRMLHNAKATHDG